MQFFKHQRKKKIIETTRVVQYRDIEFILRIKEYTFASSIKINIVGRFIRKYCDICIKYIVFINQIYHEFFKNFGF